MGPRSDSNYDMMAQGLTPDGEPVDYDQDESSSLSASSFPDRNASESTGQENSGTAKEQKPGDQSAQ